MLSNKVIITTLPISGPTRPVAEWLRRGTQGPRFSVCQNIILWFFGALHSSKSDMGFGMVGPALKSELFFSLEIYGNPVNWCMPSILPNFTFGLLGSFPSILGDSESLTLSVFLCFFLYSSLVLSIYLQKKTVTQTSEFSVDGN